MYFARLHAAITLFFLFICQKIDDSSQVMKLMSLRVLFMSEGKIECDRPLIVEVLCGMGIKP